MPYQLSYLDILAMGVLVRYSSQIPTNLGFKNVERWQAWITDLLSIK